MSTLSLQHIPSIPYTNPPSRLRTLDLWLPPHTSDTTSPPSQPLLPWIIYLHGGAWRDPLQTSAANLAPTLHHLTTTTTTTTTTTLARIAGIASLNYRLSPYPTHPTHPSDPSDPDRNVQHPAHLRDLRSALRHLHRHHGLQRWIGVGHSCGATMLLQLVARMGLDDHDHDDDHNDNDTDTNNDTNDPTIPNPEALLLLAGIYSLPLLLAHHAEPAFPPTVARTYEALAAGAFGPESAAYARVSPVAGSFGKQVWPEGRVVVLAHSSGDELVEGAQREVMGGVLGGEGWEGEGDGEEEGGEEGGEGEGERRVLLVRDLVGSHDFVWRDGRQIADLIAEVVERLVP